MDALRSRILSDLKLMGLTVRLPIIFRPYSKTMWGYYDVSKDWIVIYAYSDKSRKRFVHYNILFRTILHEYVHALQRKASAWKRYKGVMHDAEFWNMYNFLVSVAVERGILYGKSARGR